MLLDKTRHMREVAALKELKAVDEATGGISLQVGSVDRVDQLGDRVRGIGRDLPLSDFGPDLLVYRLPSDLLPVVVFQGRGPPSNGTRFRRNGRSGTAGRVPRPCCCRHAGIRNRSDRRFPPVRGRLISTFRKRISIPGTIALLRRGRNNRVWCPTSPTPRPRGSAREKIGRRADAFVRRTDLGDG